MLALFSCSFPLLFGLLIYCPLTLLCCTSSCRRIDSACHKTCDQPNNGMHHQCFEAVRVTPVFHPRSLVLAREEMFGLIRFGDTLGRPEVLLQAQVGFRATFCHAASQTLLRIPCRLNATEIGYGYKLSCHKRCTLHYCAFSCTEVCYSY